MENEFVTYEQAIALKELGFNEKCIAYFNESDILLKKNVELQDLHPIHTLAPLKQQVFRWFREKYNIQGYIYSSTVRGNKEGTKQFTGYVWNINGINMPFISTDPRDELHDTYEEAENACIDKLIEIAKQQDNGN